MKILLKWLSKIRIYKLLLIIIIGLQIVDIVTSVLLPRYIGNIMDIAIPMKSLRLVMEYAIIAILLYFISHICTMFSEIIFTKISANVSYNLKKDLLHKIYRLSGESIRKEEGVLLTLFINDVSVLENFISKGLPLLISNTVFLITLIIVLATYNSMLLMVNILIVLIVIVIQLIFNKFIKRYSLSVLEYYDISLTRIKSILSNILYNIALDNEHYIIPKYLEIESQYLEERQTLNNVFNLSITFPSLVTSIGSIIVFAFGGYQVMTGSTTIGVLTIFVFYSNRIISPIKDLTNFWGGWNQAKISIHRCWKILNESEVE